MKHLSSQRKQVFGLLLTLLFLSAGCSYNTPPVPDQKYEVEPIDIYLEESPGDESDTDKRKRITARPRRTSGAIAINVECSVRGHGIDTSGFTDEGDSLYFETSVFPAWYDYTIIENGDTVLNRMVFKDSLELVLYDTIP